MVVWSLRVDKKTPVFAETDVVFFIDPGEEVVSRSVPHFSHSEQRPAHLENCASQPWQTNILFF